MQTDLIDGAEKYLDIATPSYGSWISAAEDMMDPESHEHNDTATCIGFDPAVQRADPFPLFGAILNAVHRGVQVRLLTNDFGDADCTGKISGVPFLALNGVQVRYFTTVSFMHAKYMSADGKKVSISR